MPLKIKGKEKEWKFFAAKKKRFTVKI